MDLVRWFHELSCSFETTQQGFHLNRPTPASKRHRTFCSTMDRGTCSWWKQSTEMQMSFTPLLASLEAITRNSVSERGQPAFVMTSLLPTPFALAASWIAQMRSGKSNGSPPNVMTERGEYAWTTSRMICTANPSSIAVGRETLLSCPIWQCLQWELHLYVTINSTRSTTRNLFTCFNTCQDGSSNSDDLSPNTQPRATFARFMASMTIRANGEYLSTKSIFARLPPGTPSRRSQ
jgi:hypothetical protein